MSGIQWAELPNTVKKSKYENVMEQLKERPGQYAIISMEGAKNPCSLAAYLRGKFPMHSFVTRNNVVYACWTGEKVKAKKGKVAKLKTTGKKAKPVKPVKSIKAKTVREKVTAKKERDQKNEDAAIAA